MKSLFLILLSVLAFINAIFSQDKTDTIVKPIESTYYDGPSNTIYSPGFLLRTRSKSYYEITGKQKINNKVANPSVQVYKDKKKYKLMIEGIEDPIPAMKLQNVIESYIDGVFRGWDGSTSFRLRNGDLWVQDEMKTLFSPTVFNPVVFIYTGSDGSYKMKVEGVEETVQVKKK